MHASQVKTETVEMTAPCSGIGPQPPLATPKERLSEHAPGAARWHRTSPAGVDWKRPV